MIEHEIFVRSTQRCVKNCVNLEMLIIFIFCLGMLFVIDGSARDRLQDADDLLTSLLMEKELFGIPMVFLANKKDVEGIYHYQIKGGTSVSSASICTPKPAPISI